MITNIKQLKDGGKYFVRNPKTKKEYERTFFSNGTNIQKLERLIEEGNVSHYKHKQE